MRLLTFILIAFVVGYSAIGQERPEVNIGVVVPEQQAEIQNDAFNLLNTRLKAVAAKNGVASDVFGEFVMYPVVNVLDSQLVEGGMRNMYLVEVDLDLFVCQLSTKTEFGTCSKILKGSGRTVSDAVKNAFSKINPNDNTYSTLFGESIGRIKAYFAAHRQTMIDKASTMAGMRQYEEALSLLASYPESIEGYAEVKQKAIDIYVQYQNRINGERMAKAKSAIAIQDYGTAVDILSMIDPDSACGKEASDLIDYVGRQVKADEQKQADLLNRIVESEIALENKRIDAIRDIGVEYARHHQPQITYTQIIK